jgi:hypothetical protein
VTRLFSLLSIALLALIPSSHRHLDTFLIMNMDYELLNIPLFFALLSSSSSSIDRLSLSSSPSTKRRLRLRSRLVQSLYDLLFRS